MKKYLSIAAAILTINAGNICAQKIEVENNSQYNIKDYIVEVPVESLKIPFGSYVAVGDDGTSVPVEITADLLNNTVALFPAETINAKKTKSFTLKKGFAETYPKRTYAELAHKIGGQFIGKEYIGGYSWTNVNTLTLPGSFQDHAYYLKYEGPGWESDRIGYRFYLDNRNAVDVFGKTVSDIVLPHVGVEDYDGYHKLAYWGMDHTTVGKGLGLGSIAVWDGKNAVRVDNRDSTTCTIVTNGLLRSQIKTTYHGWNANGTKCDLVSLITIDAGSRATRMELLTDKPIGDLVTGMNLIRGTEVIVKNDKSQKWAYLATFGKQSQNKDMQGLAVFVKTSQLKEITTDELNHVTILTPENNYVEYYFLSTWELDKEPVKTKDEFLNIIDDYLAKLNNPAKITVR
jgi:hypothetical protein